MSLASWLPTRITQRIADVSLPAVWLASARVLCAVLLAYAVSHLLGLPDAHWAVMSVLIVARPDAADSAVQAGHRLRGTLLGSAVGILASLARRHDVADPLPLVMMLGVLAPIASVWPELRAAPVAAIIVSSTGAHAAGAFEISMLRLAEVAIGIAAALFVSRVDFVSVVRHERDARVARINQGLARMLAEGFGLPVRAGAPDADGLRRELRQLGINARGKGRVAADAAARLVPLAVLHSDLQFILRTHKAASAGAERASLQAVATELLAALNAVIDRDPVSLATLDTSLKQAALARATLADEASRERSVVQVFAFRRMRRQLAAQLA